MRLDVCSIWTIVWELAVVKGGLLITAAVALCIATEQTVFAADGPHLSAAQTNRFDLHSSSAWRQHLQGYGAWRPQHEQFRRLSQANESHKQDLPDLTDGPQNLFTSADACDKPQLDTSSSSLYFIDGQTLRKNITDEQGGS